MSDKEEPLPPTAVVLRYVLHELVEVKASMASLWATVDAQGQMINTLFVSLPVNQRPAALALLSAQQQALASDRDASAAAMLQAHLQGLQGLLGEGLDRSVGEVVAAVGLGNALVQSVPAHQKRAMRTWLSIATEGEIAQDALQLPAAQLDELLRPQVAAKPARRASAKSVAQKKPAKRKKSDGD